MIWRFRVAGVRLGMMLPLVLARERSGMISRLGPAELAKPLGRPGCGAAGDGFPYLGGLDVVT